MPSPITPFNPTQFFFAVRFDQGYRYLDRCGEAVIRLEDTLDRGWIPGETIPTGGQFHNYSLGLWTQFNSSLLTVVQYEFMSHKHFADQGAKILERPVQHVRDQEDFLRLLSGRSTKSDLRRSRAPSSF